MPIAMSTTDYALSAGSFLGASPLKSSFGWVSVETRYSPKRTPLRLITADGNKLALRKGSLQIKQLDHGHSFAQTKPSSVELVVDVSTRLQTSDPVRPVEVPKRSHKPRVILIAGPTAVGKTRLSIELAKALGGEIINADSVQVYQGLDIGAAKATMEERQGVPHHLMDMVPPTVDYTYEQFLADSRSATEEILAKGLVPIVIGGTGMYMRWYMHNRANITSHPFEGEDLTGEFDVEAEWDYDFQSYFLYQHRADLFPRVDIRCEQMVPAMLEESSWLLDLGVHPGSSLLSANAIGYEESMDLLVEARQYGGVITEKQFQKFLMLFQHNSKGLVKKQIAWFRKSSRSEVRKFRWIQAGQPVEKMVDALVKEYERPDGKATEIPSGEDIVAASLKEQKRLQRYKPTLKVYSDAEAVARTLEWIKSTQG